MRDRQTLQKQRERAGAIVNGDKPAKSARLVKTSGSMRAFNDVSFERALRLAVWKGYVTNIPGTIMSAPEVISSYDKLWHV